MYIRLKSTNWSSRGDINSIHIKFHERAFDNERLHLPASIVFELLKNKKIGFSKKNIRGLMKTMLAKDPAISNLPFIKEIQKVI